MCDTLIPIPPKKVQQNGLHNRSVSHLVVANQINNKCWHIDKVLQWNISPKPWHVHDKLNPQTCPLSLCKIVKVPQNEESL